MKLEIGYNYPFEIRRVHYLSEQTSGVSILYLSDLHYNRFGRGLADALGKEIDLLNPDIILLGGDYADSRKGLFYFNSMMESLARFEHIFGIAGNHDRRRINEVRKIIEAGNGIWLENKSAVIKAGSLTIQLDGGRPAAPSSDADFSILCLHKPIDVSEIAHRYNLIFAGHLHGSQAVLWSTEKGLYPGRLLYKWNRLSADFGNCRYLISKGLGDTLPIRYNCKKEAILVEIRSA
jgi:uncharacterized protein